MSARLIRVVLRLYPRRVRDRYGDELLDLGTELAARGDISRVRLIWDLVGAALRLRPVRVRRGLVAGAALMFVALAIAGTDTRSRRPAPQAGRPLLQAQRPVITAAPGGACFVDAGSACSETPCTQFTGRAAISGAIELDRTPAARRAPHTARRHAVATAQPPRTSRSRCIRYPQPRRGRPIYVSG